MFYTSWDGVIRGGWEPCWAAPVAQVREDGLHYNSGSNEYFPRLFSQLDSWDHFQCSDINAFGTFLSRIRPQILMSSKY